MILNSNFIKMGTGESACLTYKIHLSAPLKQMSYILGVKNLKTQEKVENPLFC